MRKISRLIIYFLGAAMLTLLCGCGKPSALWYVHPDYERVWNQILREANPPMQFKAVQVWDDTARPPDTGIWITSQPWEKQGRTEVYYRLSYDLEYKGAAVLALDPWMVFRKRMNPGLTMNRIFSSAGGDGILLIPGRDPAFVQAWVSRLVLEKPGVFPADNKIWQECEDKLFSGSRFPQGSQTYTWQDVLFRLMGNDQAWAYAPLSAIRNYRNPQKSILEANAFPEASENTQYSLHVNKILWAVPIDSGKDKEKKLIAAAMDWLRKPETQTIIANTLEWIPADPYGRPYDPVSLSSHRNWLTSDYIYVVNQ